MVQGPKLFLSKPNGSLYSLKKGNLETVVKQQKGKKINVNYVFYDSADLSLGLHKFLFFFQNWKIFGTRQLCVLIRIIVRQLDTYTKFNNEFNL